MIPNLLLLTGPDTYRSFQRKHFFKDAFRQKYADGEIETFDENHDFSDLETAVLTPNLFGSKRLIFTEGFWNPDIFEKAEKTKFFARLPDQSDFCTVIVLEPSLDKRLKWAKHLLKEAKVETFEMLEGTALTEFLIKYAQSHQGHLPQALAQALVHRCGADLWILTQEIQKLILVTEDGVITKSDIESMTSQRSEVVIWDFLQDLSQKRIPQALKRFHGLLDMGESPHQILAMIIREMRIHAQLRFGLDAGLDGPTIAKRTKLHPFVVQKTIPATKGFTMPQIRNLYEGLYQIDRRLKTGGFYLTTDDMSELVLAMEKLMIKIGTKTF